jgi:serine/threonine protein kinase
VVRINSPVFRFRDFLRTSEYREGCYKLEAFQVSQNQTRKIEQRAGDRLSAGATLAKRYLIQDVIGIGGMGAVYRARDLHFPNVDKLVAVKEMVNKARDQATWETIVRNFEREANLLATLSHPSIPRIYDYFTQDNRSYLILEYIYGKDLEAALNETDAFFPQAQVLSWGIELCDVLQYLHGQRPDPIVFRDMKPSNIMINQHGHVVLVDFGIAKTFQNDQKGTMIGTEGYAPPEQYRGEANVSVDIYALGASLHHLLTRRDPRLEPPFSFGERPICQLNPEISPELETVITRALEYNPDDRYQTAEEMKAALLQANHTSVNVSSLDFSEPAYPAQDHRQIWSFECQDEIRGSPTWTKGVVHAGSYDGNLYALQGDTGALIWKYATDAGVVSRPAIFEDSLCFGSEDHRLHVISARSGRLLWTYFTDAPVRSSPCVAEGHVFVGSDDGFLHAVNLLSGRPAWKTEAGAAIRSTPFIADEAIYFGTEAGEIFCVDYGGGARWRYIARGAFTSSPVVYDGVVYACSTDSHLYALDAKSGWAIWRYRLGKGSISTPCLSDGHIFTGAADGCIYCIDAGTSREVWRFTTGHQVAGSPVLFEDALYCGSVDGHLYCLDMRTGELRWKYKTGGPITGTPAVGDGRIYIGSTDNRLYALSL